MAAHTDPEDVLTYDAPVVVPPAVVDEDTVDDDTDDDADDSTEKKPKGRLVKGAKKK